MNCPSCNQKACMARPKAHELRMVCANTLPNGTRCNYAYTDEEAEETLGIKKVPAWIDGEFRDSFENTGNIWEFFPSPYCLKYFKTLGDRVSHDRIWHKIGDPMTTCIPNGVIELESKCGNDNTLIKITQILCNHCSYNKNDGRTNCLACGKPLMEVYDVLK